MDIFVRVNFKEGNQDAYSLKYAESSNHTFVFSFLICFLMYRPMVQWGVEEIFHHERSDGRPTSQARLESGDVCVR